MQNGTSMAMIRAYEAQKKYCEAHGYPAFADITCPHCGGNIFFHGAKRVYAFPPTSDDDYELVSVNGYTEEEAATSLITSCPFCRFSFVE